MPILNAGVDLKGQQTSAIESKKVFSYIILFLKDVSFCSPTHVFASAQMIMKSGFWFYLFAL